MKNKLLVAVGGALWLAATAANADVFASLSFTNPTGTVSAVDPIDVWVTLTLDQDSEALTFDGSSLASLPASLIPLEAEVWNSETFSYDYIPFASYDSVGKFTSYTCSGNFTNGCSDGEYTYDSVSNLSGWFDSPELNLAPGESQSFLIYRFTPTDGSAAPGEYVFHNVAIGFIVSGQDELGNAIEQDIVFGGTCPNQNASCSFTRTVEAVPIPGAAWLMGSAVMGLAAVGRTRRGKASA